MSSAAHFFTQQRRHVSHAAAPLLARLQERRV
jgi:hypothetical protein